MNAMSAMFRKLLAFFRRSNDDADLREEIETHRSLRQAALERDGVAPDDAVWASRRAIGNVTLAVEDARDVWGVRVWDQVRQDVRLALRGLRRSPSFAFAAVSTLALGIGANTAIFSVVDATLLRPLPYAKPDELVAVSVFVPRLQARFPTLAIRPLDFEEFRRSNQVFSDMAAIRERNFTLTGRGEPERVFGARVSASLWPLLGVQPVIGRAFLPEEDAPGRDRVILISHDLWRTRFGGDANVLGQTLTLDGQPYAVVGVMPAGFLFPTGKQLHAHVELGPRIDVWKPAAVDQEEREDALVGFSWGVIGRVKPGTTPQVVQANLDAIAVGIAGRTRTKVSGLGDFELRTVIQPLRDIYVGRAQQGLLMVMVAVGLLLVIACVNLANLLLARLSSRSRELATRAALGAPRSRLIRQLLTENLVVATLGGVVGLPIAAWGTELLASLGPSNMAAAQTTWLTGSVLLFAIALVLGVTLAVGLVPAVEMARGRLHGTLNDGSRGMTTAKGATARRALVIAEVALCTALLVVAGLLVRSFTNLMRVDKGFEPARVLSLDLSLSPERYPGSRRVAFYRDLIEDVRGLPGADAVGAISVLPLTSESEGNSLLIYREEDTEARIDRPVAHYRAVTQGYFAAMGIPLIAGRQLAAEEPAAHVVVSETLAARLWPESPLSTIVGRRLKINEVTDDPATVIGVVGDVRAAGLERDPTPAIYVSHMRTRARAMTVVIRTHQDPASLAAAVRARIWQRDNSVPVERMRTMDDVISESVAPRRFQTTLVLLFAVLALGLSLIGVYGVTSYAVTRQTREIGVRFALGAQRSDLWRSIVAQGMRPVAAGLLLGMALAWAGTMTIRSILFRVAPLDPLALGIVAIVLLSTGALACYVPARRAARMDPVDALRHD